ncbi:hypothetical protein BH23BAC1_BH23BAC1_17100 [soil metagenome]
MSIFFGLYNRLFLQGEIGKASKPSEERFFRIESCLAIRLTHVDFYKYESTSHNDTYHLQKSFIDIAPIIRISDGFISMVIQPGLSYPLYTKSYIRGFVSFPFFLQAGLEFSIVRRDKQLR